MNNSRRNFLKKAAYAAPAVMTVAAIPAIASTGSGQPDIQIAQPSRWQTRERRRTLRRMEREGIDVTRYRFSDWERVDRETWTYTPRFSNWDSIDPTSWTIRD